VKIWVLIAWDLFALSGQQCQNGDKHTMSHKNVPLYFGL